MFFKIKVIFVFVVFLFFIPQVQALEINSKYAVLYNLNENQVIFEKNKDEKVSIASLTKIMTTLVAIENIKNYEEKVTISSSMFDGLKEEGAAVIGLKNNQKLTYNDLLYGMFLASGADATRAIAISLAGDEKTFVDKMNKKAAGLGLKKTHFQNTVGLDHEENYSTVDEVAKILKEAYKNKKFQEIFLTDTYTFSDESFTVYSSFRKTGEKYSLETDFVLGAKTGYTYKAERALASIAQDSDNKITYLLVTTNAEKTPMHITDTLKIYDYYFKNYKYHNLVTKRDFLVKIPVQYSKTKNINFYAKSDIKKYLNNEFNPKDVKLLYKGKEVLNPNIKKGCKLGKIEILYKGKIMDTIDVLLDKKITFSFIGFFSYYRYIFIIIGFVIVVLFCIKRIVKSEKYDILIKRKVKYYEKK